MCHARLDRNAPWIGSLGWKARERYKTNLDDIPTHHNPRCLHICTTIRTCSCCHTTYVHVVARVLYLFYYLIGNCEGPLLINFMSLLCVLSRAMKKSPACHEGMLLQKVQPGCSSTSTTLAVRRLPRWIVWKEDSHNPPPRMVRISVISREKGICWTRRALFLLKLLAMKVVPETYIYKDLAEKSHFIVIHLVGPVGCNSHTVSAYTVNCLIAFHEVRAVLRTDPGMPQRSAGIN
jgi:hypothetical protein